MHDERLVIAPSAGYASESGPRRPTYCSAARPRCLTAIATLVARSIDGLDQRQLELLRGEFKALDVGVKTDISVSGFAEMVAIAMLPALNDRDKWVLGIGRKVIAEDSDLLERLA